MSKSTEAKSPFSRLYHVGVVVRDIDKAVKHYESLGLGPFAPLWGGGLPPPAEARLRGKPVVSKNILKAGKMGQIEMELVQPVEGESLGREFLEKHGEGVSHLAFLVDDLDKEVDELGKQGFEPVFRTRWKGGGGAAYYDISGVGGIMFEIVQPPPGAK